MPVSKQVQEMRTAVACAKCASDRTGEGNIVEKVRYSSCAFVGARRIHGAGA